MKKLISVFVLAIMVASVLLAVAGCSDNSGMQQNSDSSALLAELEELKDRVEDLENKNNVFWTDKAEYAEDETMTVYFKNTAVFEVSLDFESLHGTAFWDTGSGTGVNGAVFIKSLVADIYSDAIISTSYIIGEEATYVRTSSPSDNILLKGVKETTANVYRSQTLLSNDDSYDFVVCVPGTAFELARFVNVSIYINS